MLRLVYLLMSFCLLQPLQADTLPSADEMEQWLLSDDMALPSQSSDSQLSFIPPPKDKPPLHSINTITISPQSLQDGWVDLRQCYRQLDAVPDMEVTYHYQAMRGLTITHTQQIERAWVKGQSVQLANVHNEAQLCIRAEVRIFYQNQDGSYRLVNGPFHRRFLDSYFPYHLTMKINYPASQLQFVATKPAAQPGFAVTTTSNSLQIETYFTGKLYTRVSFTPRY